MTFTAAGSFPSGSMHNTLTMPITTHTTGNLMVAILTQHELGATLPVQVATMSSSRVTWTETAATVNNPGSNNSGNLWAGSIWTGLVNSAGSDTVNFTWSGSNPNFTNSYAEEFTVTLGYSAVSLDSWTFLNSASGTNNWPQLTPATNGELYIGYVWDGSSAAGSSSTGGWQVNLSVDGASNAGAYNPSCAAGTATAPPAFSDGAQTYGLMALFKEGVAVTSGPQQFPGMTSRPSVTTWVAGRPRAAHSQ